MMLRSVALAAGVVLGLGSGAAQAAYTYTFTQTADGVFATGSGSLITDGLFPFPIPFNQSANVAPNEPAATVGESSFSEGGNSSIYFASFKSAGPFGNGKFMDASSASGSIVGFSQSRYFSTIFVPTNYRSGTDLGTSTAFFDKASFDSLGLTPGRYTYDYTAGSPLFALAAIEIPGPAFEPAVLDSITVNVGTVPLPASAPLFGAALLGLAGVGYAAKRRKAAVTA